MPRFSPHSEETRRKIAEGQNRPDVIKRKREAANRYWKDVREGRKPAPNRKNGGRKPRSVFERFWDKVEKSTGCWNWIALKKTRNGYGMLSASKGSEYLAHRVSWVIHNGEIPQGKLVLHKCDNPSCVNPDHLFLGTYSDNEQDMLAKGRNIHPNGDTKNAQKLTAVKIRQIRRLYETRKYSQQKLADKFGVNQSMISKIVLRDAWKHIK